MQKSKISAQAPARARVYLGPRFKDVEGAGEEETVLQGCEERFVRWRGGEDGDVEGVVLWMMVLAGCG